MFSTILSLPCRAFRKPSLLCRLARKPSRNLDREPRRSTSASSVRSRRISPWPCIGSCNDPSSALVGDELRTSMWVVSLEAL